MIADWIVHPVAALFPMMTDAELDTLAADIAAHGQREPIVLFRGQVVDGRNRLAACTRAGVSPATTEYEGDPDSLAQFVVSLNLHRRHLSESQRAMVAAKLANLRDGHRADRAASIDAPAVTQTQAAEMLNVSRPSVQRARTVLDRGAPELVAAVERGEVSVSAAASEARARLIEAQRNSAALNSRLSELEAKATLRGENDPIEREARTWFGIEHQIRQLETRFSTMHDHDLPKCSAERSARIAAAWRSISSFLSNHMELHDAFH